MVICEHVQPPEILVPLVPKLITLESLSRLPWASVNPHWVPTKHRNSHASDDRGRGLLSASVVLGRLNKNVKLSVMFLRLAVGSRLWSLLGSLLDNGNDWPMPTWGKDSWRDGVTTPTLQHQEPAGKSWRWRLGRGVWFKVFFKVQDNNSFPAWVY